MSDAPQDSAATHGRPLVWLTLDDCGVRGNCSRSTVTRAIRSGKLQASYVSGRPRIHYTWFDRWMAGGLEIPNDIQGEGPP